MSENLKKLKYVRDIKKSYEKAKSTYKLMSGSKVKSVTVSRELNSTKVENNPFKFYKIKELIGEGTYGKVYRGLDVKTSEIVAIKIIPVQNDLKVLESELKILQKCSNMFITKYYNSFFFSSSQDLWIITDYCSGGSVQDFTCLLGRPFEEKEIWQICRSVLHGLVYLHENKILHRDIKGGNILVYENGMCKLADFGVATQLNHTISRRESFIGSPYWMAPEVILKGTAYSFSAEIWSLGITIIEMAERLPPLHDVHPMKAVIQIPTRSSPKFSNPDKWSKEFNNFLSKCLAKDPKKRFSAKQLLKHKFMKKYKKDVNHLKKSLEELNAFFKQFGGKGGFIKEIQTKHDNDVGGFLDDDDVDEDELDLENSFKGLGGPCDSLSMSFDPNSISSTFDKSTYDSIAK